MTKTPYEVRLDILKMAQDQANAKFYNQWEQVVRAADISESKLLTGVPTFPTAEEILTEAAKLKSFIDGN